LACELAAYFYLELGLKDKAVELFLLAHEKYHEWGAFGKCTSLFKVVSFNLSSSIGTGLTNTDTDSMGQETASSSSTYIGTGLTNTNTDIRGQETASSIGTGLTNTDIMGQETAAPNLEDDILSFLDDALQR